MNWHRKQIARSGTSAGFCVCQTSPENRPDETPSVLIPKTSRFSGVHRDRPRKEPLLWHGRSPDVHRCRTSSSRPATHQTGGRTRRRNARFGFKELPRQGADQGRAPGGLGEHSRKRRTASRPPKTSRRAGGRECSSGRSSKNAARPDHRRLVDMVVRPSASQSRSEGTSNARNGVSGASARRPSEGGHDSRNGCTRVLYFAD